jgi:pimeloyl-ACP methyl ester carboxylesterase
LTIPVLLVHGLGRTPISLRSLGRSLGRAGARPEYFGYYAWAQSHSAILDRLCRRLTRLAATGEALGLVGHSLGGLLLRQAIARLPAIRVRGLVMLGTPNRPPRMALIASRVPLFRLLTRSCGEFLADAGAFATLPEPAYPYTLIAGDAGHRGRWSAFGGEPNDGFVAVAETRIAARDPIRILPVRHTFMMRNRRVQAAVAEALALSPRSAAPPSGPGPAPPP